MRKWVMASRVGGRVAFFRICYHTLSLCDVIASLGLDTPQTARGYSTLARNDICR